MLGLTTLGFVHTLISLVAVAAGLWALAREGLIRPGTTPGRVYLWATVLTCLTGFGIFQHGGFGKPHMLGIVTLVVLAVATLADRGSVFGRWGPAVAALSYSFSLFLHTIPAVTETFTRLPVGAPLFPSPEDPALQPVIGSLFLVFVVGALLQLRLLRRQGAMPVAARRVA